MPCVSFLRPSGLLLQPREAALRDAEFALRAPDQVTSSRKEEQGTLPGDALPPPPKSGGICPQEKGF